jgi:hypothetical protein
LVEGIREFQAPEGDFWVVMRNYDPGKPVIADATIEVVYTDAAAALLAAELIDEAAVDAVAAAIAVHGSWKTSSRF